MLTRSSARMSSSTSSSRAAAPQRTTAAQPVALLAGLFGSRKGSSGGSAAATRQQKKQELLEAVAPLKRGLTASPEDQARIDQLAQQLERINPTRKPLASPLLNGRWELVYTTSASILGKSKPAFLRPSGPIYQLLDGPNLKAANRETAPLYNQVSAALTPMSDSEVAVQFKQFKLLGLMPVTAPASAKGTLDITYLDEDMRISRGNRNNLFVLTMDDPDDRP